MHASRRRRLIWLYHHDAKQSGSTIMRGQQLSTMAQQHLSEQAEIDYRDIDSVADERDCVFILTKSVLSKSSAEEIESLRKANAGNVLCADFVDMKTDKDIVSCADVLIASSIKQYVHFAKKFPDKLTHLITHHTDPDIRDIHPPRDYCNIGYFGEISNAAHAHELIGIVDFCSINTRYASKGWINRLRHCNAHYAVRNNRKEDGFKPFLKGFTAAQCNANIITRLADSDTRYYLGSEYPYIFHGGRLKDMLDMIHHVQESFGSREWFFGLDIMRSVRDRCSTRHVMSEISDLLRLL